MKTNREVVAWVAVGLGTLLAGCATRGPDPARFERAAVTSPSFFPILPWDPRNGRTPPFAPLKPNGLESIAACNFNLAGFVLPRDLPKCEQLGLGALVLPSESKFTSFNYTREWRNLSDAEIDRRIRVMVEAAGASPAVVGYFIMDEPSVLDFPALGKAVAAVKKYAPGKLAYINLFPDYATIGAPNTSQLGTASYTDYLERFVAEVRPQLLSYDNYTVETSLDLANPAKALSYFRNLLEVRRVAQKHGLPCLNIVTANQIRPYSTPPSVPNLQLQAYTTLAAGYRGVTWFTYYQRGYHYAPIDAEGRETLTWHWLREINREVATLAPVLSGLRSTGVFFTAPAPAPALPLLPGAVVETITCSAPLMVGEFEGSGGSHYAMVVNLSLEKSAKFQLKTVRPASLAIVSAADGRLTTYDEKEGCWLTAGQGVLLALRPAN
jgi:hypothetical protein